MNTFRMMLQGTGGAFKVPIHLELFCDTLYCCYQGDECIISNLLVKDGFYSYTYGQMQISQALPSILIFNVDRVEPFEMPSREEMLLEVMG